MTTSSKQPHPLNPFYHNPIYKEASPSKLLVSYVTTDGQVDKCDLYDIPDVFQVFVIEQVAYNPACICDIRSRLQVIDILKSENFSNILKRNDAFYFRQASQNRKKFMETKQDVRPAFLTISSITSPMSLRHENDLLGQMLEDSIKLNNQLKERIGLITD